MRALGYRDGRPARRPHRRARREQGLARRLARGDGVAPARGPAGRADRRGRALPPARDRRAPVHRPARPSALLRLHAELPRRGPGSSATSSRAARTSSPGTWLQSAGPSTLELIVIDWFRQWIGYGGRASGILVPGGSLANLTAVACARETQAGGRAENTVVYVTSQVHSSVTRAFQVLGIKPEQVRSIGVDEHLRMRPDALAAAIEADVQAGRQPFMVVATAGHDEHRRDRPDRRDLGRLLRPRRLAARGRGVRRVRDAHRPRTRAGSPASTRPTRSRSTRTSGSTSRTSAAA